MDIKYKDMTGFHWPQYKDIGDLTGQGQGHMKIKVKSIISSVKSFYQGSMCVNIKKLFQKRYRKQKPLDGRDGTKKVIFKLINLVV